MAELATMAANAFAIVVPLCCSGCRRSVGGASPGEGCSVEGVAWVKEVVPACSLLFLSARPHAEFLPACISRGLVLLHCRFEWFFEAVVVDVDFFGVHHRFRHVAYVRKRSV